MGVSLVRRPDSNLKADYISIQVAVSPLGYLLPRKGDPCAFCRRTNRGAGGAGWVIHIINDGPVVPPEALAGLKRRFIRGQTPSAGAGLGLAIAETIMAQTGGRLNLFSPACGHDGGFEARLITKTATVADLPAADKTARQ
jgi:signal transduction histidine kinase